MNHDDASLRDLARETIDHLAAFRDDVRVRLHLAGMEAQDLWRKAEPTVISIEKRLVAALDQVAPQGAEHVRLELHLGLAEARDRVHELESRAHVFGDALARSTYDRLLAVRNKLARLAPPFD